MEIEGKRKKGKEEETARKKGKRPVRRAKRHVRDYLEEKRSIRYRAGIRAFGNFLDEESSFPGYF